MKPFSERKASSLHVSVTLPCASTFHNPGAFTKGLASTTFGASSAAHSRLCFLKRLLCYRFRVLSARRASRNPSLVSCNRKPAAALTGFRIAPTCFSSNCIHMWEHITDATGWPLLQNAIHILDSLHHLMRHSLLMQLHMSHADFNVLVQEHLKHFNHRALHVQPEQHEGAFCCQQQPCRRWRLTAHSSFDRIHASSKPQPHTQKTAAAL